jgi:hypothetical protein
LAHLIPLGCHFVTQIGRGLDADHVPASVAESVEALATGIVVEPRHVGIFVDPFDAPEIAARDGERGAGVEAAELCCHFFLPFFLSRRRPRLGSRGRVARYERVQTRA